jgi:hypothetical protein
LRIGSAFFCAGAQIRIGRSTRAVAFPNWFSSRTGRGLKLLNVAE